MDEIWKAYPADGRYIISNFGRVMGPRGARSLQRDKDGYATWSANFKRPKCKIHKVHRAVFLTFVGPIPAGMVINHINGIKDDNRVENLEVCTVQQNTLHGFVALKRQPANLGIKHWKNRFSESDILEMRRLGSEGMTQQAIASKFTTKQSYVSEVLRRVTWRHI